jgi:hypothetical protein
LATFLVLLASSSVAADHCGGTATVEPESGPSGTTFVFTGDVGAASNLRVFRNDQPIGSASFAGEGLVRYEIETQSGDGGLWRVRLEARGSPDCGTEATFTVVDVPDTSVRSGMPLWVVVPAILAIDLVGITVVRRRLRAAG